MTVDLKLRGNIQISSEIVHNSLVIVMIRELVGGVGGRCAA